MTQALVVPETRPAGGPAGQVGNLSAGRRGAQQAQAGLPHAHQPAHGLLVPKRLVPDLASLALLTAPGVEGRV